MEDIFSVAYQQTDDEKDLEYAFFGIFDGHGGREAAQFAKVISSILEKNIMFFKSEICFNLRLFLTILWTN